MTYFRWWHRTVRLLTKPKREYVAEEWSRKLSIAYAVLAWNAFGFVCYNAFRESKKEVVLEGDALLTPGERMAKKSNKENVKIIRVSGLQMQIVDYATKEEANSELTTAT